MPELRNWGEYRHDSFGEGVLSGTPITFQDECRQLTVIRITVNCEPFLDEVGMLSERVREPMVDEIIVHKSGFDCYVVNAEDSLVGEEFQMWFVGSYVAKMVNPLKMPDVFVLDDIL